MEDILFPFIFYVDYKFHNIYQARRLAVSMLVKVLGAIDLASAAAFLMLIFGIDVWLQFLVFCAGLLLLKGFFILTGDVLSGIDMVAALLLFLSIPFSLPSILLWIPAFFLMAKGVISFF